MTNTHAQEIAHGERFEFGENWSRYLQLVDEDRIAAAVDSLREMLEDLSGKTFLDIGCGSGLFSLAARRLEAVVYGFDYDPQAVAAARELKRRYAPDDTQWTIEGSSALDRDTLAALGQFDVVYSWGVLHHTGAMWDALENVIACVKPGGILFIAIYNDQGVMSNVWRGIKHLYNRSPKPVQFILTVGSGAYLTLAQIAQLSNPLGKMTGKKRARGMSAWFDLIDWVGGYPFEVAKPEAIFQFYHARGFTLERMLTCGGWHGCNEFVFRKTS